MFVTWDYSSPASKTARVWVLVDVVSEVVIFVYFVRLCCCCVFYLDNPSVCAVLF